MTRLSSTVLVVLVLAQTASAVVDPRPDVLGLYFDESGNVQCKDDLIVGVPFTVWFVYTNPSVPFVRGFEAGFHTTATFLRLALNPPCGIIWTVEPELDNLFISCGEPLATAAATPLFSIDYLYLGAESREATFYLEKARDSVLPGTNPYIILPDNGVLEAQAGDPAYTTANCAVAAEELEWGSIKSLYR